MGPQGPHVQLHPKVCSTSQAPFLQVFLMPLPLDHSPQPDRKGLPCTVKTSLSLSHRWRGVSQVSQTLAVQPKASRGCGGPGLPGLALPRAPTPLASPDSPSPHTCARSLKVCCSPSPSSASRAACSWSCKDSWSGIEETRRGWSASLPESETHSSPSLASPPSGNPKAMAIVQPLGRPHSSPSALSRLGQEKYRVPPQVTRPVGVDLDIPPGLAPGSTLEGCPSGGEAAEFQEKEPWASRVRHEEPKPRLPSLLALRL